MSDNQTEADVVEDLTIRALRVQKIGDVPYLVVPSHASVQRVENLLPAPVRNTGTVECSRLESFILLVNQRKLKNSRFDVVELGSRRFRVILNGRTKDQPSWEDDRIAYDLELSRKLQLWASSVDIPMSGKNFAEFLEENRGDVFNKEGDVGVTAGDMIEICRTIRGTANVEFSQEVDENTGAKGSLYKESIVLKGGKGRDVEIPKTFQIAVQIFKGDDKARVITCKLRCQVNEGGKVQFRYKLDMITDLIEQVMDTLVEDTAKRIGLDPYYV